MQLQQLRVLVAVRASGSLTSAAAELGYGVPTIAHHLAALERLVRAPLVDRDHRGARMTALGEELAVEAEEILARVARTERLIALRRDQGLGLIRVGTYASLGSQLLPRAIRQLRRRRPVRVEIVEAEPIEVARLLQAGELHAGLVYDTVEDPLFQSPDLEHTVLLEEEYRVMICRSDPRSRQPFVDITELSTAEWVCSRDENEASDRVLRRACRAAGFEPQVLTRTDDLNMIHGLVAEGLGYALTTPVTTDPRFRVDAIPARQELGRRRTSVVRRPGAGDPVLDELVTLVRHALPDSTSDTVDEGRSRVSGSRR